MDDKKPEDLRSKLIAWWGSIIGVCLVIICGSVFVTRAYMMRRAYENENWRPPNLYRLETDLSAINRDGREVTLGEMRGKVYVAGHQYTDCPVGCLGLAAIMSQLEEKFGNHPDFRLVSISVNPAGDTPEKMNAWVKDKGIDTDDWWFLTGDPEEIRDYMLSEFKFFETKEVNDEAERASQGDYAHDQRLVLVDRDANIRGFYSVMDLQRGDLEFERLVRDIKLVLDPSLKISDLQ